MKKRQSLNPKKRSQKRYHKLLVLNRKLLVAGALIFLLVCGYIIIGYPNNSQSDTPTPPTENVVQSSNNYQILVIDNSTGGDVSNNTVLKDNLNKTPVVNELVETAKKGTPMVIYGNGSQPHIMIVAGVHGAELPPQIAATNLINHLKGQKINGTVYIIPFALPNQTATDRRMNNGTDPDRVAQIEGTPLNTICNTSKNYNVTMLVDFHSAQPNDVPGKNCIIYDPENNKSLELALYISNKTKSPLMKVGPYPGVLSTVSNRNNITSVVCEVLSPHSKVDPSSVELSYQYMMTFLEYSGVYNNNDTIK